MPRNSQHPPTPLENWKEDTDPLIEELLNSGDRSLHGKDSIGWMYYVIGRLQNGNFDRIDLAHIISTFLLLADTIFNRCRFSFQECLIALLLLKHAPSSSSQMRNEWKNKLAHSRLQIESLIRENESLKPFVQPMIRYAWPIARSSAANTLTWGLYIEQDRRARIPASQRSIGHWNDLLETDCPWSANEIMGFHLNDPNSELTDTRALPFDEPGFSR